MSCPVLALCLLALTASAPVGRAVPRDGATAQEEADADALRAEFTELLKRFENALEGWTFDVRAARAAGEPESTWPEHPSAVFHDRFLALARRGSPWAMAWMIENLQYRWTERADQIRESKRWYEALFGGHPDHDSLLRATRLLPAATKALGQEYVLERLRGLFEATTRDDVKGNALWAMGTALLAGGDEVSDADRQAGLAMFEQLVQTYPAAPLARDAAIQLYPRRQDALRADLEDWVAELENGAPPAEWPACPLERHAAAMRPLAETGILQARQWLEEFHRAWLAARERGRGPALLVLADRCGSWQGAAVGPWTELMLRMRAVALEHFAGEAWLDDDLEGFLTLAFRRTWPPELLAPLLETLRATAASARERACADFAAAFLLERGGRSADLVAARDAWAAFVAAHPDSVFADTARTELASLTRVLPGAVLELAGRTPDGGTLDVADLRGSVVLVDFFAFNDRECDERIRSEAALLAANEGRPLSVLGVCFDSLVGPAFDLRAAEHGVTWPCLSDLGLRAGFAATWHVRDLPTAFVLDAEGVIVARNESWEDTVAAVEALLAE